MTGIPDPRFNPAEPWGAVSRTVDLDGPVHYVDFGGPADGPTIVFVHGLGGSHLNWGPLARLLSSRLRVLAIDLVGFGLTESHGRSGSVHANARLLHRFLRAVPGEPVVLVGNSMGAVISTVVTALDPASVRGLVLIDPVLPDAPGGRPDPLVRKQFLISMVPGLGGWALSRTYARVPARRRVTGLLSLVYADLTRVEPAMVEAAVAQEQWRESYRDRARSYLAASRSMLRLVARRGAYWRRVGSITQPVLLVHGEHDRLVPVAYARAAARRLPAWRYVELDAGHVPQLELPGPVAEAIGAWLADTGLDTVTARADRP